MFKLTDSVVSDIIFAMENQNDFAFINIETGEVSYPDEAALDETDEFEAKAASVGLASLPDWSSSDGFSIMEDFVANLEDYAAKKTFRAILEQRRGVFRSFKEVLKAYPEMEISFYRFKDERMKARINDWYAALGEDRRDDRRVDRREGSGTAQVSEGAFMGKAEEPEVEDLRYNVQEISPKKALGYIDDLLAELDAADVTLTMELRRPFLARLQSEILSGRGVKSFVAQARGLGEATGLCVAYTDPDKENAETIVLFMEAFSGFPSATILNVFIPFIRGLGKGVVIQGWPGMDAKVLLSEAQSDLFLQWFVLK